MLKPKQAKSIPLHVLLDDVEKANKKDSWDYTGGHLNHNHLFKPPVIEEKSFWKSRQIPDQKYEKTVKMKDSFLTFTLKTSLVSRGTKVKSLCARSPVIKQTGPCTPINTPFTSSFMDTWSQTTCRENPQHECTESPPKDNDIELLQLPMCERPQTSQDHRMECKFLPAYFTGLTKLDQFNIFLKSDWDILQKQDMSKDFYKNVTVESFEKKLMKELMNIAHIRSPHFARLQIFSETFEKICKAFSTFGNVLSKTKAAYDLYVNHLLDAQSSPQHEILMFEIAGMKKRPVKTKDVEKVMQNVRELEHKTFIAIERNDQLRNDLKTELSNTHISETVSKKAPQLYSRKTDPTDKQHANETEAFVAKRSEVLKTLMEVNALEEDIKKNLTHALNVEVKEQYVKDIQKEIVKLKSSNDFLHRANKDLDSEVKRVLMKQKFTLDKQEEIKILMESFLQQPNL
ncbi:uncharacterized protein C6orf118 homolog [Leptodactylus fuscus]